MVTHSCTIHNRRSFNSVIRRELVHSTRYLKRLSTDDVARLTRCLCLQDDLWTEGVWLRTLRRPRDGTWRSCKSWYWSAPKIALKGCRILPIKWLQYPKLLIACYVNIPTVFSKIPTYRVNSLSLNTFQSRGRDKIFKIRPYFILLTATTVLNTYKRVIDTVDRSVKTQGESRLLALLASRFAGQKKSFSPRDGAYVSPRLVSVIRRLVVNTVVGTVRGSVVGTVVITVVSTVWG